MRGAMSNGSIDFEARPIVEISAFEQKFYIGEIESICTRPSRIENHKWLRKWKCR
jgi:hypothetical protein